LVSLLSSDLPRAGRFASRRNLGSPPASGLRRSCGHRFARTRCSIPLDGHCNPYARRPRTSFLFFPSPKHGHLSRSRRGGTDRAGRGDRAPLGSCSWDCARIHRRALIPSLVRLNSLSLSSSPCHNPILGSGLVPVAHLGCSIGAGCSPASDCAMSEGVKDSTYLCRLRRR